MASCKDCVHYEACASFANMILDAFNVSEDDAQCLLEKCTGDASVCNDFADRSRFVELPCKLGDEIFYTTMGKIHQAVVDRIELYDEGVAIITADGYCVDSTICYHTQEAAEQALKERETDE